MTKSHLAVACACLLSLPLGAQAQNSDAHDNRTEISVAMFAPDIELSGKARLTVDDGASSETFSERGHIDGRARGGMIEASYRFTPRQRVMGSWYGVRDTDTWNYADQGTVTDENGDALDYDYAGRASLRKEFELYSVSYGYDFVQRDRFTATAKLGVYGAKLDLRASNEGYLDSNGEMVDLAASESFSKTSYAPGVGVSASWRPADRWDIRVGAQGFRTSWGNFDRDGHFIHANAQVGYRFARNWTAFAGYDWFELELRDRVSGSGDVDGTTYTVEGPVSARLRVHGPTAGLRANF